MPMQNKEVEIVPHHRPTEWVKAAWWAFVAIMIVLIICMLFIQRPHSFSAWWNDVMTDFVGAVILILGLVVTTATLFLVRMYRKYMVIDAGQFGTYLKRGRDIIELPPMVADNPVYQPSVNLVTPSKEASNFLPYMKIADYLKSKGVELSDLEDCIDPPQPADEPLMTEPPEHLTELQKRVLNLWERGNHGRASVHKADPTISEHLANKTIVELKAKGVIE